MIALNVLLKVCFAAAGSPVSIQAADLVLAQLRSTYVPAAAAQPIVFASDVEPNDEAGNWVAASRPPEIKEMASADGLDKNLLPMASEEMLRADRYDDSQDLPLPGSYLNITESSYDLGGFQCGKGEPTVKIWYPTDLRGKFPIACYGHGIRGTFIPNMIESVVSLGFIVIAPATSGGICQEHHLDMLHALDGSKADVSKHEALRFVDWTRTALFGHSMGAYEAIHAASLQEEVQRLSIKAVAAAHGDFDDPSIAVNVTIPGIFLSHHPHVRMQYRLSHGLPKVYAALEKDSHMEPAVTGELNPFVAHFLACHVASLHASCLKVYGQSRDSLCRANEMAYCEKVDVEALHECEDDWGAAKCERRKASGACHERDTRLQCQKTCGFGCSVFW